MTLEGNLSVEDVNALGAYYRALHAREQRFTTLIDARRVSVPNAAIRRALADMSNAFTGMEEKNTVSVALLLNSAVLVFAMRAIQWFLRKSELRSFAAPLEAYSYLADQLTIEGLTMPPGARAAVERMG